MRWKLTGLSILLAIWLPQIFIFAPNDSPSKTMEATFYFIYKALFVLEIFNFLHFCRPHLFLLVGHCFRGSSKMNLKVHDVINCLNKNSITHFVWYLEKEKRYGIGVSDTEHFYRKIVLKKCAAKASPRPFYNFGK